MKNKETKHGFTLAELLIVVAIIAVLTAISIPIFSKQLEKARDAESVANIRSAYSIAMMQYMCPDVKDTNMDGNLHSHALTVNQNNKSTKMTVNFRNGVIEQICVMGVNIKSKTRNNWSGLANSAPFYDALCEGGTYGSNGDIGVPRIYFACFNFTPDGEMWKLQLVDDYVNEQNYSQLIG